MSDAIKKETAVVGRYNGELVISSLDTSSVFVLVTVGTERLEVSAAALLLAIRQFTED